MNLEDQHDMYDVAGEEEVSWEMALGCLAIVLLSGAVMGLLVLALIHLTRKLI